MPPDVNDLADIDAASLNLARDLLREFMAPPPLRTVTEWAEKNRRLSGTDASEPGPYRVRRTPYAREPQDCMSPRSPIREVVLMWAAQTSKTTVMLNCIGASMDGNPGPVMIVWPTNTVAKRNSRQRVAPLINESPALARRVSANRSRDKANTTLLKEFDGGILVIAGANSAADLRSMPIRDLYLDEVDNFPPDVDGEGDPVALAEARQTTFARRKRMKTSTPLTKGMSSIEKAFEATDRCYYHVPCPHCGAFQRLEFGADKPHGLRWDRDDEGMPISSSVRYVCAANGCEIREHLKPGMLAAGVWIAEKPGAAEGKVRGFHLNGLYSPLGWFHWREMAQEWAEAMRRKARGDLEALRGFVNNRLAETFEEDADKADVAGLKRRAGDFPLGVVQPGHVVCTLAVDVQDDRLHYGLWAWGRGMRRQLVDRGVFWGSPGLAENLPGSPWTQLTAYRRTPIVHVSGRAVPLLATAIDSGGHHTHSVYMHARQHQAESVLAIRGEPRPKQPILGKPSDVDISWQGQRIKRGVKLWPIGSDTAKVEFYGRLRVTAPGDGYVLLSKHLPDEAFDQLTSERLATRIFKGRPRQEWLLPPGRRNEDLDCHNYAHAAALWLGVDRWADGAWSQWETRVETPMKQREEGHHEHPAQAQAAGANTEPPASERQPRSFLDTVREQFGRQW